MHSSQFSLSETQDYAIVGRVVVVQFVLGSYGVKVFRSVVWLVDSKVFPVLVVSVCLALLDDIAHYSFFLNYLLFYESQHCHLHAKLLRNCTGDHHSRRVKQEHQRIAEYFEPAESSSRANRCSRFGSSPLIIEIGYTSDLIDDGRFTNIRSAASHHPQSYLFVLMLIIFLEIGQDASHIVMFLAADSKASYSVIVVILNDLVGLALVAKIVLVEYYQLLFLVFFDDKVEFRVSAAIRNAGVSDLHENVHLVRVLFDQAKGLLHVAREPVYVIFEVLYHIHFGHQLSLITTIEGQHNSQFAFENIFGCFQGLLKIQNIINLSMKAVHLSAILLLSCLTTLSYAWEYNNPYRLTGSLAAVKQDWIDQPIDHLNYNSKATFRQRYYALQDYYQPNGPAYLYICGEAECRGISNSSWLAEIARQTHGIIFALEHRYYGKSLPFGNDSMSFENLKFLNSEQGLSDLAFFINYIKTNKLYGVQLTTSWITVGGSYAGAMSAWFRAKYPHLTVGALGSSGVVLAVEDFKAFDEQIYQSALKSGPECVAAIQDLNKYVEGIINSDGRLEFQAQFKAEKLTAKEFLFYWADVGVLQFQYSKRVEFCASIAGKSREEVFSVFKAIALTVTPVDYGAFYLKNASFAIEDGRGARAWIYQSCTEFSYFQTYSDHPMRSLQLDLDFYKSWCADIFGAGVWPFVNRVNNQFGGLTLEATNLYMSNGDEDPWRWASLQKSRKNIIAKVYVCPDCGHCADLAGPKPTDADTLKAVRAQQFANIQKWLAEASSKLKVISQ